MKNTASIRKQFVVRFLLVLAWILIVINYTHAQSHRLLALRNSAIYSGLEFSMGGQYSKMTSGIKELQSLKVGQNGGYIGYVAGNEFTKFRTGVSLYYSNENTSRTIDKADLSMAGNFYLLRIKNPRFHTIEPYSVFRVAYQRMKYFGTYLGDSPITNYSVSQEPVLGTVDYLQINAGLGLEYQLVNLSGNFVHLFAEATAGQSVIARASKGAFRDTGMAMPVNIVIGVSFGMNR